MRKLKNPNGAGTIVYLGKNRRRPYAIRKTAEWVNGKQIRPYLGYYATLKEARAAFAKEQLMPRDNFSMTFKEVYENWKASYLSRKDLSKQSIQGYDAAYKNSVSLHDKRFMDLRTSHMQSVIDGLEKSVSTKRKVKLLFNMLSNHAMQIDLTNKNYAQFVHVDGESVKSDARFTQEEIDNLFEHCETLFAKDVLILIYTGVRIQELMNLKNTDVNFDTGIITCGIKTEAGKGRAVPIHEKIREYLKERCAVDGYLYTTEGRQMKQEYFRKDLYYPTLEALNIPKKKPHRARHTCASLLKEAGADNVAIMKILGHADYAISAETYTHPDIKFLIDNMNKIE